MKPPNPIKTGQPITADFLNRLRKSESSIGWGSGETSGANIAQPGVQWFQAQEAFTSHEDVYRGDSKLWWRNPADNEYAVHGTAIKVYSHFDGIDTDDIIPASFNFQSGRWEVVSPGTCSCPEVDVLNIFGTVISGQVTLTYSFNGVTDDVVLNYNSTASAAKMAFEAHTGATTGDFIVFGGQWPVVALHVVYQGTLASQNISIPGVSDTLVGTNPEFRFWKGSSHDWTGY